MIRLIDININYYNSNLRIWSELNIEVTGGMVEEEITCIILHALQFLRCDGGCLWHEMNAVVLNEECGSAVVFDGRVLVQPNDVVVHRWCKTIERLLEVTRLLSGFQISCSNTNHPPAPALIIIQPTHYFINTFHPKESIHSASHCIPSRQLLQLFQIQLCERVIFFISFLACPHYYHS